MKKILLLLSIVFILSSCFSSNEDLKDNSGKSIQTKYDGINFSMIIPAKWEVIKDTGKILPKPSDGEVIFDAVSNVETDGFYRNILVLKQNILEKNFSSLDFIIGNYIGAEKEYFYIKKLATKNVKIDSKNTRIYEFEAKYSEDTPILKFLQTGIICDKKGYLITIALEKSNHNIERYEGLLGSFSCKNKNIDNIK